MQIRIYFVFLEVLGPSSVIQPLLGTPVKELRKGLIMKNLIVCICFILLSLAIICLCFVPETKVLAISATLMKVIVILTLLKNR
jgi:hypothetical protein